MSDWRTADSSWVLDHGLPSDLPSDVPDDLLVPIAFWVGKDYGAVVSLQRAYEDLERYISTEIEVYHRTDDGWEWIGGGGSDWASDQSDRRVAFGEQVRSGHIHMDGYHEDAIVTWYGRIDSDVTDVKVVDLHGAIRRELASPFGIGVVLAEPRPDATVSFFGREGAVIGQIRLDWEGSVAEVTEQPS